MTNNVTPIFEAGGDSALIQFAKAELKAAGYDMDDHSDHPNAWMRDNLLQLLRVLSSQGHSGHSNAYLISAFAQLASFKPLGMLTGEDSEWVEVGTEEDGGPLYQNKRCSSVFKGADGKAYNVEGRVFVDKNGAGFTNSNSRVWITFPYRPKTEYVDVNQDGATEVEVLTFDRDYFKGLVEGTWPRADELIKEARDKRTAAGLGVCTCSDIQAAHGHHFGCPAF